MYEDKEMKFAKIKNGGDSYGIDFLFTGCSRQKAGNDSTERAESSSADHQFPSELAEIPDEYMSEADQQGQLKDLYYDTYESKTYDQKNNKIKKTRSGISSVRIF